MRSRTLKTLTPVILVLSILFIQAECDLVSFGGDNPVTVTVTLDEDFHITASGTDYSEVHIFDIAELYDDNGVNTDNIEDVTVSNIELTITQNNTGDNTTASGTLAFKQGASAGPLTTLASFSNLNLNDALGMPINPFTAAMTLGLNPTGVLQLQNLLSQMPPPDIRLEWNGSVNQPPVDFQGTVAVTVQVKYKP